MRAQKRRPNWLSRRLRNVQDAVEWRLCVGCGACFYACPNRAVVLENVENMGIRPRVEDSRCEECGECLQSCPGWTLDVTTEGVGQARDEGTIPELGRVLSVWEGYAGDKEIRHQGSSGGILSALALYCIERQGMESVIHTGMDEERPWLNRTVRSRTRAEILSRAGSRYAPASPCDGLQMIEESRAPCVFIGKPCDAAGTHLLCRKRPDLRRNTGVIMSLFCAGTPSTEGTLNLLESSGVTTDRVECLRYRGEGWPGEFKVWSTGRRDPSTESYRAAWGYLCRYRPLRCYLCPDGLGQFADLSSGDAWHDYREDGDPGRSIVLVRTYRGKEILEGAVEAGYVLLKRLDPQSVVTAQSGLAERHKQLFGRLLAMRMLTVPIPRYLGFSLRESWGRLPVMLKARSIAGTVRRILQRGLWRRARPRYRPRRGDQTSHRTCEANSRSGEASTSEGKTLV